MFRRRDSGEVIANPMGTFRGYGGEVGIYPYRQLAQHFAPPDLGALVIELLALSGGTGYSLKEMEAYRRAASDPESEGVRAKLGFTTPRQTTGTIAKRFARAVVETNDKSGSYLIKGYRYDPNTQLDEAGANPLRVKKSSGPEALGVAVLAALADLP